MRGQVAFEYMMIFGLAIAFMIPVWLYVSSVQQGAGDELSISYAENAAKQLTSAADLVYTQGPPAKVTLDVYIPDKVTEINVSGKMVIFGLLLTSGESDIFSSSICNLSGIIPASEGKYVLSVESKGDYVEITKV